VYILFGGYFSLSPLLNVNTFAYFHVVTRLFGYDLFTIRLATDVFRMTTFNLVTHMYWLFRYSICQLLVLRQELLGMIVLVTAVLLYALFDDVFFCKFCIITWLSPTDCV